MESDDKKTVLEEIKKGQEWLDANGATASVEEIDEQREALQAIIGPITAKAYQGGASGEEPLRERDEL